MRVLWFEVSIPGKYKDNGAPICGWQDSLEYIVRSSSEIELNIAFRGEEGMTEKIIDGIRYIPLVPNFSRHEKNVTNYIDRNNIAKKIIPLAVKVIHEISPDIIQVFGSEWEYGLVAKYTNIPVVLHMQGCIIPYTNMFHAPGYSVNDELLQSIWHPRRFRNILRKQKFIKSWALMEYECFKSVRYYMGRTDWDRHLVELFHPGAKYYYCSEALRPSFINNESLWKPHANRDILKLITIGCSGFRKGMDVLLKTANLLKKNNIKFEWHLCGQLGYKNLIEKKTGLRFEDNNIVLHGFVGPDDLVKLLIDSDIYVHPVYLDNSPNSICEAQYLGLPIVATYVGGVPSLIENGKDGILVPANHPFEMTYQIIRLAHDLDLQQNLSDASVLKAHKRHNPNAILRDLLNCYHSVIQQNISKPK